MAIATLATFQRFRWLLVGAVLSSILVFMSLSSDITGNLLIPLTSQSATASNGENVNNVPLRLLLIGDSVVKGMFSNGHNGFRLELRNQIIQGGRSVDFIGTQELGMDNDDNQHEGWGGMVISIVQERIMANGILTMHPNLVLLQAGSNDNGEFFGVPAVEPADTAIDRLENLMNAVLCENPDTTLLVGQIQDNRWDDESSLRVQRYNSQIPVLVAKKRAQGFKTEAVDLFTAVGDDLDDNKTHPSESGYLKMAHAWYKGIESLPSNWIQPARIPLSKAPWSWYKQQKAACKALKGWERDSYIIDKAIGEATFPPHWDMSNWTRIHDL